MKDLGLKILQLIKEKEMAQQLLRGNFGLEKENVRVDEEGHLALTEHPSYFGRKATHPYIKTDFSESQIEMVTPVFSTIDEAYHFLLNIHHIVSTELSEHGEYLWTSSNPPLLPNEEEIPIARMENRSDEEYRYRLAEKYGRKKQLLSGIHYNFSFQDDFLYQLYQELSVGESYREFKDQIYLKLIRNFMKYRWFMIDMTGASPVFHQTYNDECVERGEAFNKDSYYLPGVNSFRNSVCGYKNRTDYPISYDSVTEYVKDIEALIEKEELMSAKEYYSPIRIKANSNTNMLQSLVVEGIEYVEVRLLDLNPLFNIGISKDDLYFLHLFNLYMLFMPEDNNNPEERSKENSLALLQGIREMLNQLLPEYTYGYSILSQKEEAIVNEASSYAEKIKRGIRESSYVMFHMKQSFEFLHEGQLKPYQLVGYTDMELSTQILIKDAIKRGIKVEITDREENFISLQKDGQTEYVKQATKTSLDSYSTVLIMENKLVTKEVLGKAGIRVPRGQAYHQIEDALADYEKYKDAQIVIKPKSTNFGIGITIFTGVFSKEDYHQAFQIAFQHDHTVLLEEYLSGKEYRFLVMGDEVTGILHRVPANVVGDGASTITELVAEKNKDSLRGKGYKTPLEKIQLGESEALFLRGQGKNFDYIPLDGEIVYLRENSNISTGGDSLDYTDDILESYKKLAVQSAKAAGAVICGVDMVIDDIGEEANEFNYGIIEINFNPAIHIHCYPFKGKNRKAGEKILDLLFGERK